MLALTDAHSFTVKDVPAGDFIKAYAAFLKKNDKVEVPAWVEFAKTGTSRELCPEDPDFIYTRIAAVARKIYLRPHLGVGAMRHIFGKNDRSTVAGAHHSRGAGGVIRYSLHQLEKLGVVSKDKKYATKKNSRVITKEGQKQLDIIANNLGKEIYNKKK